MQVIQALENIQARLNGKIAGCPPNLEVLGTPNKTQDLIRHSAGKTGKIQHSFIHVWNMLYLKLPNYISLIAQVDSHLIAAIILGSHPYKRKTQTSVKL